MVRHEVACVEWRVGDVAPGQCSRLVSALTCAAGNDGGRSSGFKPKGESPRCVRVAAKLYASYDWCARADIDELSTLATIETW